jgi:hypothetical protein
MGRCGCALTSENSIVVPLKTRTLYHAYDLLDQLHGANVFSSLNLRSVYHQVQIKEGVEYKIAFKTQSVTINSGFYS